MSKTETKTMTVASKSGSLRAEESRATRTMGFVRNATNAVSVSASPATDSLNLHPMGLSYRSLTTLTLQSTNTADHQ